VLSDAEQKIEVMPVKSYRELVVWQKSMDFAAEVYRVTRAFPREEMYGVTSQLRRAVVSVPSNIAEGQGAALRASFANFWATLEVLCSKLKRKSYCANV
jgi:hypothetical protein